MDKLTDQKAKEDESEDHECYLGKEYTRREYTKNNHKVCTHGIFNEL